MAAAAAFQHPTYAGRSYTFGPSTTSSYRLPGFPTGSQQRDKKLTLSTSSSSRSLGGHAAASTTTSHKQSSLRRIDTDMTSYSSSATSTIQPASRVDGVRHGKLHKRNSSGNSLPASPSPMSGAHSQFTTPFATYEEPFPDISTTPTQSQPKIKPYLRKLSSAKDERDQGRLDLSKSTSENAELAGLGINDFGNRSAADVSFSHTGRRTPHMRTTSVGSQVSTASGSYKPTQPFVHPMRQTPSAASYTPTQPSYASSMNDEEARESSDIVIDDDAFQFGHGSFRGRRSISISSTPQTQPTPLSQSHTAADFDLVPKLTSTSQSNLSLQSNKSSKSKGRSRRNTDRSTTDFPTATPSSRTSFDRAFSLASRRSNTEPASTPQTDEERIMTLRKAFNEKEARKRDEAARKEERRRRKSEASERDRPVSRKSDKSRKTKEKDAQKGLRGRSYESTRPGPGVITALPYALPSGNEKVPRVEEVSHRPKQESGGLGKFMRLLSCGGSG